MEIDKIVLFDVDVVIGEEWWLILIFCVYYNLFYIFVEFEIGE